MEQKKLKKLKKENERIRKEIDKNLKYFMTTINDSYNDIWENINLLIENEIEQEKLCNN